MTSARSPERREREPRPSIFIAYARDDAEMAHWIADSCRTNGYRTVLKEYIPGSNEILDADRALRQTTHALVLLSRSFLATPEIQAVWSAAFKRYANDSKRKLIPVQVENLRLEGLLGTIAAVKIGEALTDSDEDTARDRLVSALDYHVRQSKVHQETFESVFVREPKAWDVRPQENPNFFSRDKELQSVHEKLQTSHRVAITGMGGVGKTQLVSEYVRRATKLPTKICWVNAEDKSSLQSTYVSLASKLGLNVERMATQLEPQMIEDIKQWFETHNDWILVFDNVEEAAQIIRYLPENRRGNVIATSRNAGRWTDIGISEQIKLKPFTKKESVDFLQEKTGFQDEESAGKIAERVDGLPLALELVRAYLTETPGVSFKDYLELLNQKNNVLGRERPPSGYPKDLISTIMLSFDRVNAEVRDREDLKFSPLYFLLILAMFNPSTLPVDMCYRSANEGYTDKNSLFTAITTLSRHSLLLSEGSNWSMHRLIRDTIVSTVDNDSVESAFGQGLDMVDAYAGVNFGSADLDAVKLLGNNWGYIISAIRYTGHKFPKLSSIILKTAYIATIYYDSADLAQEMLDYPEVAGDDSVKCLKLYLEILAIQNNPKKYLEAGFVDKTLLPKLIQAEKLLPQLPEEIRSVIAIDLYRRMGNAYKAKEMDEQARDSFFRGLDYDPVSSPTEIAKIAILGADFALFCAGSEDIDSALDILKSVWELSEIRRFDSRSLSTLTAKSAEVYRWAGELNKAEKMITNSIVEAEKVFVTNHRLFASRYLTYAKILSSKRQPELALRALTKAQEYQPAPNELEGIYWQRIFCLVDLERFSEAIGMIESAFEQTQKAGYSGLFREARLRFALNLTMDDAPGEYARLKKMYINNLSHNIDLNAFRSSRVETFDLAADGLCEKLLSRGLYQDLFEIVNALINLYNQGIKSHSKVDDGQEMKDRHIYYDLASHDLLVLKTKAFIALGNRKEALKACEEAIKILKKRGLLRFKKDDEDIANTLKLKEEVLRLPKN